MSALPQDIALYTTDGVQLFAPTDTSIATALKNTHINARRMDETEREMFFDVADDGQALLNEAFAILSVVNPAQYGIETGESLGLGRQVAITPNVPCYTVIDRAGGLSSIGRLRAYSIEYGTDRFAVELLGQPAGNY